MVNWDLFKSDLKAVDEDELIKRIGTNMTNDDIERYLGSPSENYIIKYAELENIKNINELLPMDRTFKIILIETEDFNIGHWVAILRFNNCIEYFNSYGEKPDKQKNKLISKLKNFIFNQDDNELTRLIKNRDKDLKYTYNDYKFQKLKEGINTCGRWLVLRILLMRDLNMELDEFKRVIVNNVIQHDIYPDALVSIYIP